MLAIYAIQGMSWGERFFVVLGRLSTHTIQHCFSVDEVLGSKVILAIGNILLNLKKQGNLTHWLILGPLR